MIDVIWCHAMPCHAWCDVMWFNTTYTEMTSPFLPGCRASRPSPNTPRGTRTYHVRLKLVEMRKAHVFHGSSQFLCDRFPAWRWIRPISISHSLSREEEKFKSRIHQSQLTSTLLAYCTVQYHTIQYLGLARPSGVSPTSQDQPCECLQGDAVWFNLKWLNVMRYGLMQND